MFTSGIFGDLYVVDSNYYNIQDDMTCFNLSKMYHNLPEDSLVKENSYEVKYGKVKNTESINYLIYWYDGYKPGTRKLRVYKIKNI